MIHHITRATRHLIFWSLITVALGLTGIRLLMVVIDNYKAELQNHISAVVDAPVQIGSLKARMHGFTPSLVLKDIEVAGVADGEQTAIKLDEIRLHIDLWDVLLKQDIWTSSWLTLVGAEFSVTQRDNGRYAIVGLKTDTKDQNPLWLLQGGKLELLHSRISWLDQRHDGHPIAFDRVNLVIKNDAGQHQLHMLLKLPGQLGDSMRVSMVLDGNFWQPDNINGRMYFEGYGVHLAKTVTDGLPMNIAFNSGVGNFKVWSDWRHSQLKGVTGEVEIQKLGVRVEQREVLSADKLFARFNWKEAPQAWQLDVSDFILVSGSPSAAPAKFSIRGQKDSNGLLRRIAVAVDYLELQQAVQVLTFPELLSSERSTLIKRLKLSGRVTALALLSDLNSNRFTVDGQFQELSFSPVNSIPGLSGLSGTIHGNDRKGWLQFETGGARMDTAGLFRQTLSIDRLEGRINWRQTLDDWIVDSNRIELDVPGIVTESRIKLVLPNNEASPFLDLQTRFSMADVRQATQYLPAKIMHSNSVAWLDRAFVAGRIPEGGLLMRGELANFPYTEGQGVFEVLFNVEQLDLVYDSQWPQVSGLESEVRFWSDSLTANVQLAKLMQCSVKQAFVTIPSFNRSQYVKVRGQVEGSIQEVLGFLQQTPLKAPIDQVLAAVTPEGLTLVDVELDAPLVVEAPVILDGFATLNDAQLEVASVELPVTQINGKLKFNESGVYATGLDAIALGQPIQARIDNQPDRTVIDVVGRADIETLQKQFGMSEWKPAAGEAAYGLKLLLPYDDRPAELTLNSDLQGIALDLPEALAKTRDQKRPLSLRIKLGDERVRPVKLNYDNTLKAAFSVNLDHHTVHSGHFLYGQGEAFDSGQGIKLEANRDRIQLEAWQGVSAGVAEGSGLPIRQLEIHTQHLINEAQDLGRLDWSSTKSPEGWRGKFSSLAAEGDIHIPNDWQGEDKISLDLQFIDFSTLNRLHLKGGGRSDDPLPLLEIKSQKTFWHSVDLGRLELETERIAEGLAFKRIELVGPQRRLSMTGSWTVDQGQSSTRLQGSFVSEEFGRLIAELGLYDDMKETDAYTDFILDWRGAPYQFALDELNGHVDVKLKHGRLSSIEPGVGRVLGILAFAQWGKRLKLDFRDVYKEGLSFNSIRGRVNLSNGIARTDNLIVNAVPAKISLVGDANLMERTLDQLVTVVPKSSDAVPIAGTIVGRIAGLVASAVTDDYKEGYFFGSEYQVKGSWQEPEIIPLHENDGLIQKTWQGITDFSWIEEK
ncbi:MAG: YhdP family protein [Gammaproteobacteria bacterium]